MVLRSEVSDLKEILAGLFMESRLFKNGIIGDGEGISGTGCCREG